MNKTQKRKIFISYARVDAPKVDVILQNLIASGVIHQEDYVLKEENLPSNHRALREEVKKRIQEASKFIVVWGSTSSSSQWVNYEIGLADALGKPIIAVLASEEEDSLPVVLQNVNVVKLIHHV